MNGEMISLPSGQQNSSRGEIIQWWEERRLMYNPYVGLVGIVSALLVLAQEGQRLSPGLIS
jgi:hypothetical protein